MRTFLFALALALGPVPVLAQDFDTGVRAHKSADYVAALREWRPLAEQGDAVAQYRLGFMYDQGLGVPQDHAEAMRWYRAAAAQGNALAQNNLGLMYARGQGVPRDRVTAHMWLNLAAANGIGEAADLREILARRMTRADISEAQRRARVCLESGYRTCDR